MKKVILVLISILFLLNCSVEPELSEGEKMALKEAKAEIAKMRKNPTKAEKERILQKGKESEYLRIRIVYFKSVEKDIPMADYYLAKNYSSRGLKQEALKWAKKGSDKGITEASRFAGYIYANLRDNVNAKKYYIKAMEQGDYSDDTLFRVWLYGKEWEIDMEVVEALKRNINKNVEVKKTLAFYYERFNRFDEAEKLYKELVDEKYPNGEELLGSLYMFKNEYDKAEKWLLKASEKLFSHSEDNAKNIQLKKAILLRKLAKLYEKKGEYGKAENYLLKSSKIAYKEVALMDLAELYKKQEKYSQAKKIYEELAEAGNKLAMKRLAEFGN